MLMQNKSEVPILYPLTFSIPFLNIKINLNNYNLNK